MVSFALTCHSPLIQDNSRFAQHELEPVRALRANRHVLKDEHGSLPSLKILDAPRVPNELTDQG